MNLQYASNPADVARGIVAYSSDIRPCRCGRPTNTLYRDYRSLRLVAACCPEHAEPAPAAEARP